MSDYDDGSGQSFQVGGAAKAGTKNVAKKGGKSAAKWVIGLLGVKIIVIGLVVLLTLLLIIAAAGAISQQNASAATCGTTPAAGAAPAATPVAVSGTAPGGTTPEQWANAQAIAGVALGLGLGRQGVLIGIVVAITESTLINVGFGDYNSNGTMTTSRGLFQQIGDWGPLADRMDPVKSATMFYTVGQAGQRGLTGVSGWQSMDTATASQAVQGSQFASGSNYQSNLGWATSITDALMAGAPTAGGAAPVAPVANVVPCPTPVASTTGGVPVALNGPVVTIPDNPNVAPELRGYQLTTGSAGIARGLAAGFVELGMPYVWGGGGDGAGPNNGCARGGGQLNSCGSTIGFDCSGLSAYVIVQGGFPSPGGNSGAQAQASHAVPWPGLPGDLIVFPGHVAIDLGSINGTVYILEASDVGTPIRIVALFRTDHDPSPYRYWS